MKISVRVFESGERYVFLLNDDGVPDFWVTHFVNVRLRMDKAWASIEQYLKDIKHLKLWEKLNNRNLLDEIYQGRVPDRSLIRDIQEHCRYSARAFKVEATSNIVDMSRYYLSTVQDKPTVSHHHFCTRIAHIAEFLYFTGHELVKKKPAAAKIFDDLDRMNRLLKSSLPRARLKKKSTEKPYISDDAFEDFVEVANFNSKYNPFKNEAVRFRNYLMIQTLYETGLRRSELLAIQISDIGSEIGDPRLFVKRRHDSKEDPRMRQPTAKTLGRGVAISEGLRSLFYDYIKRYRVKTRVSKSHPYIFVSHQAKKGGHEAGEPLEQGTVNKLFKKIQAVNPERFMYISPHEFRHFYNDQLSVIIDKKRKEVREEIKKLESMGRHAEARQFANENTITEQRELEVRAELNGHSSLESGRHYLSRTAKREATWIRKRMHEALKHKAGTRSDD